jgi:hypothetical protein
MESKIGEANTHPIIFCPCGISLMGISFFRGANIKLQPMVTKTLQKPIIYKPAGFSRAVGEKQAQTTPEVKSYKPLEHTNRAFEKKNSSCCPK